MLSDSNKGHEESKIKLSDVIQGGLWVVIRDDGFWLRPKG